MEVRIPLHGTVDTLGRALGGPRGAPRFESGFWALPGHLGVVGAETLEASSHLSPALDGVCGLMHLPLV